RDERNSYAATRRPPRIARQMSSTMIAPTTEPMSPEADISSVPPKMSAASVPPTNEPMSPSTSVPSQPIGSGPGTRKRAMKPATRPRSEEHTSELQSRGQLGCRLLREKKKEE